VLGGLGSFLAAKRCRVPREVIRAQGKNLSFKDRMRIESALRREIEELFHGRNLID
jgi:hypothetical protein